MKKWSLFSICVLPVLHSSGQICSNPRDTAYSLNTAGVIYRVNVNDAGVGPSFPPLTTGSPAENSNGLAYSNLNGKFYYFHRSAAAASPYHEFVSYDPATATLQLLATIPIANNRKIRSGTMNNAGTGYYTIDPVGPTLYFYKISTNSWTPITSNFVNASNVSQNTTFTSLNSGDMAFDGSGNLWILLAKSNSYALYKIPAPVATSTRTSVTVEQVIAPSTPPGTVSITGLAFNSDGNMYLSTGTGDNHLYRLSSPTSGLTPMGTFATDDIGADLTSCTYPFGVLSIDDGQRNVPTTRLVQSNNIPGKIYIGPNPVQDALYINMNDRKKYLAQVFDRSGRLLYTTVIGAGQQAIAVAGLPQGTYILKLTTALSNKSISYQFAKN